MGNLDLLSDEQWSSSTYSKKVKRRVWTCNAISVLGARDQPEITALMNLETEMTAMATHPNDAGLSGTWSDKNYLNDYWRLWPSKSVEASGESPRFQKNSNKDSKATGVLFWFNMLAQLVNIAAQITLYELL